MANEQPYAGARPYDIGDHDRFYGRESESRDISALWQRNRFLVVHGSSGVGKTSLIRAGIISRFNPEIADVLPLGRVSYSSTFPTAALPEHNPFDLALLSSWSPADSPTLLTGLSVAEFLRRRMALTERHRTNLSILGVIDQFEELFDDFQHRLRYVDEFIDHLAEAIEAVPRFHLLILIRESSLANLAPYESKLTEDSLDRFQVLPLTPDAALRAVTQPLAKMGHSFAHGVAEKLVEDLRSTEITNNEGIATTLTSDFVAPMQLQVSCAALWQVLPESISAITEEHLHRLDVGRTLAHFCTQMVVDVAEEYQRATREIHEWLEQTFITELGTRGTVYEGLSETGGMPNAIVHALEDRHILDSEQRYGSRWYQLSHDRLIQPIRQANRPQIKEEIAKGNPHDYLRNAHSSLEKGEIGLARKHAEEALRLCADNSLRIRAEAESFLGNIAYQRSELDEAESYYRRAAEHFEAQHDQTAVGQQLTAIGRLLMARGRNAEAVEVLHGAVERLQGDLAVKVEFARALWASGQLSAAAAVFGIVLTIGPDQAEALAGRGQVRVEMNDPASALQDLDSPLLQLRPDISGRAEVRAARALALARLDRIEEAITEVDAALADAPDRGSVLLHASGVARAAGQPRRASHLLRRAHAALRPALLPYQLTEVHRLLDKSHDDEPNS